MRQRPEEGTESAWTLESSSRRRRGSSLIKEINSTALTGVENQTLSTVNVGRMSAVISPSDACPTFSDVSSGIFARDNAGRIGETRLAA